MTARVGFIGIGRMGRPMARRIAEAGFALTVHDVDPANAARVTNGTPMAANAAEIARRSDVVLSCVPGPTEVEDVYFGTTGVLASARAGMTFVETSTIDVALSKRIGAACAALGAKYLDAPLSGGTDGAAAGTLTAMVGGDADTLEAVRPVLACFANRIVHLGPAGCGHLAKIVNQMIYLGYVALFCEALSVADAQGVGRGELLDVLEHSVAGEPLSTHWHERLRSGDREPGFPIARVLKDLHLGEAACDRAGAAAPIVRAALAAFEAAAADGQAGRDMTVIAARRPVC